MSVFLRLLDSSYNLFHFVYIYCLLIDFAFLVFLYFLLRMLICIEIFICCGDLIILRGSSILFGGFNHFILRFIQLLTEYFLIV